MRFDKDKLENFALICLCAHLSLYLPFKTLKSILGDDAIDIQHIGSTAIQAIRDYLNANENVALQYQKLKEELESKYADDRVTYTNGKQDMIDIILNCK